MTKEWPTPQIGPQQIVVPDLSALRAQQAAEKAAVEAAPLMDVLIRWNFPIYQEKVFRNVKIGSDQRLGMLVLEGADGGTTLIQLSNVLFMHVNPTSEEAWDAAE